MARTQATAQPQAQPEKSQLPSPPPEPTNGSVSTVSPKLNGHTSPPPNVVPASINGTKDEEALNAIVNDNAEQQARPSTAPS